VQDSRVVQWLQDGFLERGGEEGTLVWGLVPSHERVYAFLLLQDPVEEAEGTVGYLDLAGDVDGAIERELDALDEVKGDGVLESSACNPELCFKAMACVSYMSWKRILARSSAFVASDRSNAASMVIECFQRVSSFDIAVLSTRGTSLMARANLGWIL